MTDDGRSLLAEMALRFVDQRELLATSSLGLLLERSSICRTTLAELVPADVPDALTYRSEGTDPGAEGRPDVVGALGGERHVIIEGKFWAGLTAAQPVMYINSLTEHGVLLVVAPHSRFPTIGAELLDRLKPAGSVEGDLRIGAGNGARAFASSACATSRTMRRSFH